MTPTITTLPIPNAAKGARVELYLGAASMPCAAFYNSDRIKKPLRYRFKSEEHRSAHITSWAEEQQTRFLQSEQYKHTNAHLSVGDVLYASWGYEQTNIDFYQITKAIGKTTIELRQIKSGNIDNHQAMTGKSIPAVGQFIGETLRVKPNAQYASIDNYFAYPLKYTEISGVRIYESKSYSTYG